MKDKAGWARAVLKDASRLLQEHGHTETVEALARVDQLMGVIGGDREAFKPGECRSCRAAVVFVHNARSRKLQILNQRKTVVWISTPYGAIPFTGRIDHHATCPQAKSWERRPKLHQPEPTSTNSNLQTPRDTDA